jgi:hypothetical protein
MGGKERAVSRDKRVSAHDESVHESTVETKYSDDPGAPNSLEIEGTDAEVDAILVARNFQQQ